MNISKINKVLVLFISIVFIVIGMLRTPIIIGDGREYLGMTISFANHFSFNLTEQDKIDRKSIENKNNIFFLHLMK